MIFDKIIIGAGLYGLYAAEFCGKRGENILVIEYDSEAFKRATYINQARVHMGYHYPRSYSTAIKSAGYFERFNKDYGFCIHSEFEKIYATSTNFSWTNASQFRKFCDASSIRCDDVNASKYFKEGMCDGTFVTTEYTYDAHLLRDYFLNELSKLPSVTIIYSRRITEIKPVGKYYEVLLEDGKIYSTEFLLNATYASTNQVINMLGFEPFKIKYELCEMILCKPNS